MSSKTLLNLALLSVVAVLGLVAVFEPGIAPPPVLPPISDLEADAVTRIEVRRPDQDALRLERREGGWRLTAPLQLPANGYKAEALLGVLAARSQARFPVAELDLAGLGLDPPKASLLLDGTQLDFGDTESLSGNRYLRLGDTVHLVRDRYYHHLIASAAGFADPSLLGPAAEPESIVLPEVELTRADGHWQVKPEPPELGADAISRLVEAWRGAQAVSVRTLRPAAGDSRVQVRIKGAAKPLVFEVRRADHETVFARPDAGVQYHVTAETAARLLHLEEAGPADAATADEP